MMALIGLLVAPTGMAQAEIFSGKTVTVLIGSAAGGPTDASGRLVGRFLTRYLPGAPAVVVQNMPGANGVTALTYFVQRTDPDGLMAYMGANTVVDPMVYRTAKAQYDPKTIRMAGGIGFGGTLMFISQEAEKRLYDKSLPPVIIGNSGTHPAAGMQPALWGIEYLGWNAKWVVGYRGMSELLLAFDRGEVDLTSTSDLTLLRDRLKTGRMKVLLQGGSVENGKLVGRPEFGDVPIFRNMMEGKISDPTAQKAFEYWVALSNVDKWLGLAPKTPDDTLAIYRDAFRKFAADKEFMEFGQKLSTDFSVLAADDVETFVRVLADTPPEALTYLTDLMRKQGLRVAQ
jgi:hypothetical protein